MASRILTAAVGIPLLLAVLLGPPILTQILIVTIAGGVCFELLRLTNHNNNKGVQVLFYGAVIALTLTPNYLSEQEMIYVLIALVAITLLIYLTRWLPPWFPEGVLYLGFPLATIISLRLMDHGREWIVVMLAGIWVTDSMAMFGGKYFGRTQLTPISPKKTREGTAIGIVFGIVAVIAAGIIFDLWDEHRLIIILTAMLLPPLAVIGDLIESKIKRNYGKKDSGAILPGHGGILDRIDSTLVTATTLWLLVVLLG